jgi:hypothetical protein
LSAALAPEEFELVIPEKKTNFPQVPTYLGNVEFVQSIRQTHLFIPVGDIQETYVKVLNTRAEPAHFVAQPLKPLSTLELAAGTVRTQRTLGLPWSCQWITVRP